MFYALTKTVFCSTKMYSVSGTFLIILIMYVDIVYFGGTKKLKKEKTYKAKSFAPEQRMAINPY